MSLGLMTPSSANKADDFETEDSETLLELNRLAGSVCTDCREQLSSRDTVFSIVMGFKNAPRCLMCLGLQLGRVPSELRDQLIAHIHRRDCFLKAWREAERRDAVSRFYCEPNVQNTPTSQMAGVRTISGEWDAGDMGCGELVMALRLRMNDLSPGSVLKVTATDSAAPEDLPAWCRMSGHTLVAMQHPTYFIQRKGD